MQFNSEQAPEPVGAYPHARRVGDLLFLSGVGPRQRGSKEIPGVTLDGQGNIIAYDIEKQCHSVFQNVRLILEASGSRWENLIDVTVYLTNMKDDFKKFNSIYAEYFKENQPCRTTVEVNALPTPIAIELKCIATVGPDVPENSAKSF
jgi:2-aminomuconate deaminase